MYANQMIFNVIERVGCLWRVNWVFSNVRFVFFFFSIEIRFVNVINFSINKIIYFSCVFNHQAAKKGVSTTVTGLIFSIVEFVNFVTSPFFGNYVSQLFVLCLIVLFLLVNVHLWLLVFSLNEQDTRKKKLHFLI